METPFFEDFWAWLGKEIVEFGLRWLIVAIIMLGFGGFIGWRYRWIKNQITALKDQSRSSGINQVITFHGDVNIHDYGRQLRDAIEAKTSQNLKETITRLQQNPLGDGNTYAKLPDGTKIVTMADGEIRLAIPVHVEPGIASAPEPGADMSVTVVSLPKP